MSERSTGGRCARVLLALGWLCFAGCSTCSSQPDSAALEQSASTALAETPTEETEADENKAPVPERVDRERWARYREHLREGRRLTHSKDWEKAIEAFEQALVQIPNNPRALGELGWAVFQAGDHARATSATRKALRGAIATRERAALYYNLGRIAEARDRTMDAADAYRAAYVLRPSEAARRRLEELRQYVPETHGDAYWYDRHLQVQDKTGFGGPEKTLGEACPEGGIGEDELDEEMSCEVVEQLSDRFALLRQNYDWQSCYALAIRTEEGWWTTGVDLPCEGMGNGGVSWGAEDVRSELIAEDMVVFQGGDTYYDRDWCRSHGGHTRTIAFCGVAQGEPVCWGALTLEETLFQEDRGNMPFPGEPGGEDVTDEDRAFCAREVEDLSDPVVHAIQEAGVVGVPPIEATVRGDRVAFSADAADRVPETLVGEHAIRELPCLLPHPPAIFGCSR